LNPGTITAGTVLDVSLSVPGRKSRFVIETDHGSCGPNSYVLVLNISTAYMRKIIPSAVGIASLNSLRLHAINSPSLYALTIMLLHL